MQTIEFASKHGPEEFRVFSCFSDHPITTPKNITFHSAEQAYQWSKFYLSDPTHAARILRTRTPWDAKKLGGHKSKGLCDPHWNKVTNGQQRRVTMMIGITRLKLAQHADIHQLLLNTGHTKLIHWAPWDDFWGAGKKGNGQNILGHIWMELRATLPK